MSGPNFDPHSDPLAFTKGSAPTPGKAPRPKKRGIMQKDFPAWTILPLGALTLTLTFMATGDIAIPSAAPILGWWNELMALAKSALL